MNGKTGSCCGTVRAAGHDDPVPTQRLGIVGQKIAPSSLGILFGKPLDELKCPLLHAIGLGNINGRAEVLAGGRFESNFSQILVVIWRRLARQLAKPAIGIMHLDSVQAIASDALKECRVIPHKPNDEPALWGDPRVYGSPFQITWPSVFGK